jgi:hypothetical protein
MKHAQRSADVVGQRAQIARLGSYQGHSQFFYARFRLGLVGQSEYKWDGQDSCHDKGEQEAADTVSQSFALKQ